MANGASFKADISAWALKNGARMEALARQTAFEVSKQVVVKTPVDTGFLRSSWQPSIGSPKPAANPGGGEPDVMLTIVELKPGDTYWMTNNASYARFVEFGTSRMPGRFFLTDTVTRWKSIVAKVAKRLGTK